MMIPAGVNLETIVVDNAGWVRLANVKLGQLVDPVFGIVKVQSKHGSKRGRKAQTKYHYTIFEQFATYTGIEAF